MPSIKEALSGVKSTTSLLLESQLNRLFSKEREIASEERIGLHGSGVIVSDSEWCLRKNILSFVYKQDIVQIPIGLQRVFLEGWYVHMKWQKLFEQSGIARGIEQRGHSNNMQLLFTPDAIIELNGRQYVVEIKSMNEFAFKRATTHLSGIKQLMLYMHMLGIPNGFVLAENKNNQEIKIFEAEYEPNKIRPFIQRMLDVKDGLLEYKKSGYKYSELPERICAKQDCKQSMNCSYKSACYRLESAVLLE